MKKSMLLIGFCAFALMSFAVIDYQVKKNTCEAVQISGVFVFTDCRPVSDVTYMGTVSGSTTFSWSEKYTDARDKMIKKAKKEFPGLDGVVLSFDGSGLKADAVAFK